MTLKSLDLGDVCDYFTGEEIDRIATAVEAEARRQRAAAETARAVGERRARRAAAEERAREHVLAVRGRS